jgi:hypothetical protein
LKYSGASGEGGFFASMVKFRGMSAKFALMSPVERPRLAWIGPTATG